MFTKRPAPKRRLCTALVAAVLIVATAACGTSTKSKAASSVPSSPTSAASGSSSGSSATTASGGSTASGSSSGGSVVSSLPTSVQAAYEQLGQPVDASPWANFKPKGSPPWTIGYSSEYAGNNWRATGLNEVLHVLLPKYKAAGLVKQVVVEQSNLSNSTQIQQIEQMVNQGVDAIFTCCAATDALNGAIAYAHSHGVPFFTFSGYVSSPYAVNTSANFVIGGEAMATSLFQKMGGKGNLLDVTGIDGTTASASLDQGMHLALAKYPGIHLVGSVAGNWTDSISQSAVEKFLSTHSQTINGVFTQDPGDTGTLQAFIQAGRTVPPMTISGETGPACYWVKHPSWISTGYYIWPPADEIAGVWDVMIRTLEGQGPKIQSIARPVAQFSLADAQSQVNPANCSLTGSDFLQAPTSRWFSDGYLNQFFEHPADPLSYKG